MAQKASKAGSRPQSVELVSDDAGDARTPSRAKKAPATKAPRASASTSAAKPALKQPRKATEEVGETDNEASAAVPAKPPRASTSAVKPALKQPRKPAADAAADADRMDDEAAEGSAFSVEALLELENAKLSRDLKGARDEMQKWKDLSNEYRLKWEQASAQLADQADVAVLRAQVDDLKDQLEESLEARKHLSRSMSIFNSFEKPGTFAFVTVDQARQEREEVEAGAKALEEKLAAAEGASTSALQETREQLEQLREENTALRDEQETLRAELRLEIEQHKAAKAARTPNGIVRDATHMSLSLYEDLTNLMLLKSQSELDPDTGTQQWLFTCMCTGSDSQLGQPKSLQFTLRMFHDPAVVAEGAPSAKGLDMTNEKGHLNQCKYLPLSLEYEPDNTLAQQLDFLSEPFTFARGQLDIFFRTLADRLKAQDADGSLLDESMDVSGVAGAPITVDD